MYPFYFNSLFLIARRWLRRSIINEIKIDDPIRPPITESDHTIGNLPPNASFNQTIFNPTKINTEAKPYLIYANRSITPANIKYIDRNPRIANMFDVKTINGSRVSAKIAGTESTAKIMSLSSKNTSARKSGVT